MELKPAEIKRWPVVQFGTLYGSPSRNGIYKTEGFHGSGCRIVNMGEMFGLDFISDQDMSRVALTERELATSGLEGGDLLFGRRSVVESGAGRCSLVVKPSEPLTFESSIIRVRLKQDAAIPLFFYYFFRSPSGRRLISQIISGTNVKGIRGSELKRLPVPIPPLREQNEIAKSLSDIDELIDALDKLIAKKRDLEQAVMQQLLTGKKRLPGFSGEWEEKTIAEIGTVGRGRVISHREIGAAIAPQYPVYSSQTSSHGVMGYLDIYDFEGEYVTWTTDGANAGKVFYRNGRFNCTNVCGTIKVNGHDALYVALLLDTRTRSYVSKNLANPKLMNGVVKRITLSLPPRKEQSAIAAVLSDMDAEIAVLEQKRDKTRAIRQGMMQELLTGKTRLT